MLRALRGWKALAVTIALALTPVGASALSFSLNGQSGLDRGQICTAGGAQCSEGGSNVTFDLDPPAEPDAFFPAVGTIDLDLLNNTMDIALSVASSRFVATPADNGVSTIVFTNTSYTITGLPITISAGSISLNLAAPNTSRDGTVAGTYTQLDALNSVVVGAQGFSTTARISNQFSCQLSGGNTLLTCGITFGPGQTSLSVNGVGRVFRHGFDFTMAVPEPGATALLGLGVLGVLGVVRRARG